MHNKREIRAESIISNTKLNRTIVHSLAAVDPAIQVTEIETVGFDTATPLSGTGIHVVRSGFVILTS